MSAKQMYDHLVRANIFGVRDRVKKERKNPKNIRYARRRRRK